MDQSGQAGTSSGGGGGGTNQNQMTSSRRIQNQNPNGGGNLHEKIHQMIYGYLIRNGLTTSAESLRLESRHLPQNHQQPFMILNDSMHDHNLEEIIQLFHRDGHFGISQNMVAFGIELRNITRKFIELVPQCVDSNSLHQQLYGQSVFSRQQAQMNYNLRPAPQAYAHLKQKEQNLQAEICYLRGQIPTAAVPPLHQQQLEEPQVPPPPLHQNVFGVDEELPRSSRRKPTHPQNRNVAVENAFVGYINERAEGGMPINSLLDEPFGLDFTLRPEFLMSYDPMHSDDPLLHPLHQEDQQRFDEVFETVLTETEQQRHLEGASLVVEEEVIVETTTKVEDYGSNGTGGGQVQYPPTRDVDRLLSPILRHRDFQSPNPSVISHHSSHNVSSSRLPPPPPPQRPQNDIVAVKKEIESKYSDERKVKSEKKERKYDEKSERSARSSVSPTRSSRTSDENRRRDRDRDRRHRDSEKEKEKDRQEKSNKKDDRRKERKHDSTLSSLSSIIITSSNHHRHRPESTSSALHLLVQNDRESTSSAASTITASDSKKETESERRRRKEKDREAKEKEKASSRSKSRNPEHAANLLATIKTAGGMTSTEKSGSTTKRKAESSGTALTTYKIPKRAPNSTPSHDQSFGSVREASTTKGERDKKPFPDAPISEGFDVEDNTRFILPTGHAARLSPVSSILITCNTAYKEFHRLKEKENNEISSSPSSTTTNTSIPPPPIPPTPSFCPNISSTTTSQSLPPPPIRPHHPKGHQYAPMKGASMAVEDGGGRIKPTESRSSGSSSSGSSSSGNSTSDATNNSEDEEAPPPSVTSSSKPKKGHHKTRRSESPEEKNKYKKLINQKHADKLLDRLHGK